MSDLTLQKAMELLENEARRLEDQVSDIWLFHASLIADFETFSPLVSQAVEVFGDDAAVRWLVAPVPRFANRSPLQMVIEGEGEAALTYIMQINYGVYM